MWVTSRLAPVVRLREPQTSLAKRFRASPADSTLDVYESPDASFLEVDSRTFVVASATLSQELALSKTYPALASPGMETLLRNTTDSTVIKVQKHAQQELSRFPQDMLWAVKKMKPGTMGSRQIIGRFPAMLQAVDVGTTAHVAPTFARLVTLLPEKAAANLAAGALLTWDQSLLTNFDEDPRLTSNETMTIPDKIADRLEMKILLDFRNTPLQEAFAYIGESVRTEVTIDGKAFEGAGLTVFDTSPKQ